MSSNESLRDRLRAVRAFGGEMPTFHIEGTPATPLPLLVEWLELALEVGVVQPHAMALATASADGLPSNRTVLLKDVDDAAVWFASLKSGPKGDDLAENPRAALVFYWREQGRQVRVTGRVEEGPREVSERDFLQRHPAARTMAIAGDQSEPMENAEERLAAARELVAANPEFVPETWVAYRVIPDSVEFWQAERERDQVRLRYVLVNGEWERQILWP